MHTSKIINLLLLPVLALAQVPDSCAVDNSITGYCTITTFTDQTGFISDAPTTAECKDTCADVLTDAGDWIVNFAGEPAGYVHRMVAYPCAFSVGRGADEPLDYKFAMHNQDIVYILDQVIQRYGRDHKDRVAAQGTMVCGGRKAVWYVN